MYSKRKNTVTRVRKTILTENIVTQPTTTQQRIVFFMKRTSAFITRWKPIHCVGKGEGVTCFG